MKITYLGHACFQLTSSNGTTVITDPYTGVGYELPQGLSVDAVTVSHGHFDHNYLAGVRASRVISQVGEYEFDGVKIVGCESFHDGQKGALRGKNILFTIEMDGIKLCHFGDLGETYRADIAEKLGGADIFLIPVGGTYTIDARQAKEYVDKCKPCAVIPMHYRPLDGKLDIAEISSFLELFPEGEMEKAPCEGLEINADDLNALSLVIYMERRR